MVDAGTVGGDGSPGLTVAMHMSDGLVNAPTAAVFGLVAAIGLAIAASRARADLDERTAPMAGLVTAFVFAVQMINFPILPGASGHLLGGALVAILVGPWVGSLCIAIVLVVQALLFADGGLTALGTNITNMALVGTFTGYVVAYALRRFAARSRTGLLVTSFVAALINTVVASLAFVLEYAIGGAGGAGLGTVFSLMVGLHVLVGIGEGIITAATVGAVAAVRPDLVYLLRGTRPAVTLRTPGEARPMNAPAPGSCSASCSPHSSSPAACPTSPAPTPTGSTRSPCTAAPSARPHTAHSSTAPASPRTRPITRWPAARSPTTPSAATRAPPASPGSSASW